MSWGDNSSAVFTSKQPSRAPSSSTAAMAPLNAPRMAARGPFDLARDTLRLAFLAVLGVVAFERGEKQGALVTEGGDRGCRG